MGSVLTIAITISCVIMCVNSVVSLAFDIKKSMARRRLLSLMECVEYEKEVIV